METSTIRVLVVEDYEPFRRFVCSTLRKAPGVQVIGEVADGLEAVRKAEEQQPDLILLDLGLPGLNGIEAARRIRKLSPNSKIIFVSQEFSADVVQEGFSLGALGYVVKARAASELLAAVEAVCQGRQFVSQKLSEHNRADAWDAQAPDPLFLKEAHPSPAVRKGKIIRNHEAQFYSDDASLLAGFARFIEAALEAGRAVIVVTTESRRKDLLQRLREHGVDSATAIEQGRYIPLDVTEILATFMVNDLPDPARFREVASGLLTGAGKAAKGKRPRVAACGECAPTLWAQGNADAAIQLEHLWDEIAKTCDVDILCGYVLQSFQRGRENHIYERICAEHSSVACY